MGGHCKGPCGQKHDYELCDDGALPAKAPVNGRRYMEELARHCLRMAASMRGMGEKMYARALKLSQKATAMVIGLRNRNP